MSAEHQRYLDRYGLDTIKRHQALQYFTWHWGPLSAARSSPFRFLLRHTSPRQWWAAWRRAELPADAWAVMPWSRLNRRLYTFATRLPWRYAERQGDPRVPTLGEPSSGLPVPVYLDGRLISQDLANTALEVRSMALPSAFIPRGRRPAMAAPPTPTELVSRCDLTATNSSTGAKMATSRVLSPDPRRYPQVASQ